jgi:hypothetical protein
VTRGTITRLVRSHGPLWGNVRLQGTDRDIFFTGESLAHQEDLARLSEGNEVWFEERDTGNDGVYAEELVLLAPLPISDFSRPFGR